MDRLRRAGVAVAILSFWFASGARAAAEAAPPEAAAPAAEPAKEEPAPAPGGDPIEAALKRVADAEAAYRAGAAADRPALEEAVRSALSELFDARQERLRRIAEDLRAVAAGGDEDLDDLRDVLEDLREKIRDRRQEKEDILSDRIEALQREVGAADRDEPPPQPEPAPGPEQVLPPDPAP